jgi:hypothetical protein
MPPAARMSIIIAGSQVGCQLSKMKKPDLGWRGRTSIMQPDCRRLPLFLKNSSSDGDKR